MTYFYPSLIAGILAFGIWGGLNSLNLPPETSFVFCVVLNIVCISAYQALRTIYTTKDQSLLEEVKSLNKTSKALVKSMGSKEVMQQFSLVCMSMVLMTISPLSIAFKVGYLYLYTSFFTIIVLISFIKTTSENFSD